MKVCAVQAQVELAGSMGGCRAFVRGMRDFHQRAQCRVQQLVAELAEAEAAFRWANSGQPPVQLACACGVMTGLNRC